MRIKTEEEQQAYDQYYKLTKNERLPPNCRRLQSFNNGRAQVSNYAWTSSNKLTLYITVTMPSVGNRQQQVTYIG